MYEIDSDFLTEVIILADPTGDQYLGNLLPMAFSYISQDCAARTVDVVDAGVGASSLGPRDPSSTTG